ncbi:hypothetical protein [Micromonospora chalcea]|uniref:hypothetical protein n=1 Tax=Micromonospora chalcea TaxID=1874 RepID=UPI003D71D1E4
MAGITDEQVSAVNDSIAQARTTAQAFRIIDGLTRTMLARLLDLNHETDAGLGVAGREALGRAHGWDPHERDDDRPTDGYGPCELGRYEPHSRRPWECRCCKRRRIDHRPVTAPATA